MTTHPDHLTAAVIRELSDNYFNDNKNSTSSFYAKLFQDKTQAKMIAKNFGIYDSHCHPYVHWNYLADSVSKLKKDDKLCAMVLKLFSTCFNQDITDPRTLKNVVAKHYMPVFKELTRTNTPDHLLQANPELHAKQFFNQHRLEQGSVLSRSAP